LNARGDCPLDICRIADVDVAVDDDRVLDVRHAGKQKMQNLLRIRIGPFPERQGDMGSAARGAEREILHGKSLVAQRLNDLRFAGRSAQQRDFV